MSRKILVTGSREFTDYQLVYDTLDRLLLDGPPSGLTVIHGAARGADSIADVWAVTRANVHVVRVPADWENNGSAAGPMRNTRMLELNPDFVVAFFKAEAKNTGTKNMVSQAKAAHIAVLEVYSQPNPV